MNPRNKLDKKVTDQTVTK